MYYTDMKYLIGIYNMLVAPFSYAAFKKAVKTGEATYEFHTALIALLHFTIAGSLTVLYKPYLISLAFFVLNGLQVMYGFVVVLLLMKHMVKKVITDPDKPIYYYSQEVLDSEDKTAAVLVLNKEFAFVLSKAEVEMLHKASDHILHGNELDDIEETEI